MMNQTRGQLALFVLAYGVLLVYGTWFPLTDWDWSRGGFGALLALELPVHSSRADLLLNLIVYMPFGLLLCAVLPGPVLLCPLLATLAGASLSLVLEVGQTFLPGRVSSPVDLALNAAGTALGALVATAMVRLPLLRGLMDGLQASLREPGLGSVGLSALALWALSQWVPFVPSLDIGNLRGGLAPLKATLVGAEPLAGARLTSYVLMLLGVGAVAVATLRPGWGHGRWLSTALLGVLLLKVPILGRVLSSEALLAIACVTPALLFLPHQPVDRLRLLGVLALVAFYCHGALQPGAAGFSPGSMNWVPLRGHIGSVHGVANLLETIWVFVALAFLSAPRRPRGRWPLLLQGLAILAAVFALEWYQQFLPGRYADISDVLVAFAAWWLAMRWGLRGAYAYCPVPPGRWGAWRFGVQDRTGTPR